MKIYFLDHFIKFSQAKTLWNFSLLIDRNKDIASYDLQGLNWKWPDKIQQWHISYVSIEARDKVCE